MCPICMLAMGQDAIPEAARSGVRAFWQGAEAWVARTVRDGQQRGELSHRLDPQATGSMFVAALEGGMVAARAFSNRARLDHVIGCLMELVSLPRQSNEF